MNLPDPQQLLPRMAADLKVLLARRGVAQAHFIGIRTGGVWAVSYTHLTLPTSGLV